MTLCDASSPPLQSTKELFPMSIGANLPFGFGDYDQSARDSETQASDDDGMCCF